MTKKFNEFLEETVKTQPIVFSFGRMNPPTIGHAKLIGKILEISKKVGGDPRFYPSHSQGSSNNPIPYKIKVQILRKLFPQVHIVDDPKAVTAFHIAKTISDQGYRNIIMVVGSDRVEEFRTTIGKYVKPRSSKDFDSKKHYGFDSFKVISAGERDPEARGIEGISASKLRSFAADNNFDKFSRGVPTTNLALKKQIFDVVKKNLHESFLEEGPNDPGIFKAIFITGGPGSGKSYVVSHLKGLGLTELNSDIALEFLMKKHNMSFDVAGMDHINRANFNVLRSRAKDVKQTQKDLALSGRRGIILNFVGDDLAKTEKIKRELEDLGYETMMIFVNVPNEISKQRNNERLKVGSRRLPDDIRQDAWEASQRAIAKYWKIFTIRGENDHFIVFNNINTPEAKGELERIYRKVMNFVKKPIAAPAALHWLSSRMGKLMEASYDMSEPVTGASKSITPKTKETFTKSNNPPGEDMGQGRYVDIISPMAEANTTTPDAYNAVLGALQTE
jgi:hypothetical protein